MHSSAHTHQEGADRDDAAHVDRLQMQNQTRSIHSPATAECGTRSNFKDWPGGRQSRIREAEKPAWAESLTAPAGKHKEMEIGRFHDGAAMPHCDRLVRLAGLTGHLPQPS